MKRLGTIKLGTGRIMGECPCCCCGRNVKNAWLDYFDDNTLSIGAVCKHDGAFIIGRDHQPSTWDTLARELVFIEDQIMVANTIGIYIPE
jgi:hypothetical protein